MPRAVLIAIRFHDGRYHGEPEWPPSPARLFQALLAGGAGRSGPPETVIATLRWLEALGPPIIAAPLASAGRRMTNYVPNNDLDAMGGDPARIDKIREGKTTRAVLFDAQTALLYAWDIADSSRSESDLREVCRIADSLYQLGRGVDMAWAWGEVLDDAELQQRLAAYPGVVYRPSVTGTGATLAVPQAGSLDSLLARHAAQRVRFRSDDGKQVFAQPPRPRFRQVAYNSPVTSLVYELDGSSWPLDRCAELVELVRDMAAAKLADALPARTSEIERAFIGRGATQADKALRIQVSALPSIGHSHADQMIRRVLVRVPPNCPVARDTIDWAFSGLMLQIDKTTGEVLLGLVAADADSMLKHYGADDAPPARRWRTVTPVVLPRAGTRRSGDTEAAAVVQALRHADLPPGALIERIQREPFDVHGKRAEAFAHGRFAGDRLWHVEVRFTEPIPGPIVVGDGRYLGLGLMRPMGEGESNFGLHCLRIEAGLTSAATVPECVRALRRATMARVQEVLGVRVVMPTIFSGHAADGAPSSDPDHGHLAFAMDPQRSRLLILAPHRLHGRPPGPRDRKALATLDAAIAGMRELRAGASGLLRLTSEAIDGDSDPLFRDASVWESVTDYAPTRHAKRMPAAEALAEDAKLEIARRGLAAATRVDVLELRSGPRGGLAGRLRIHFRKPVPGPLVLGRTRHLGGGLFIGLR